MAKEFGAVLAISYKDEKSKGKQLVKSQMEILGYEKSPKKLMQRIGERWWYVNELFNFVVNLFSFRAKPKDAPEEFQGDPEFVDVEFEEEIDVPYQQGRQELREVAEKIIEQHRKNLSRPWPPSSRPGAYPHKRSGTLIKSIQMRYRGPKVIEIGYKSMKNRVWGGDPIVYSQALYEKGRLGLEQTAYGMMRDGLETSSRKEISWQFTDKYH